MDLTANVFRFLHRYDKPVSTHSFALFRVLFALHIIWIISEVFRLRELIFDAVPGVSRNVFPALLYLNIWLWSAILLMVGLFTRYATWVNYACVVIATALFTNSNVGTFNDDLLRIGSLLCAFMPVARSGSVDRLIQLNRFIAPEKATTSYLNYILFIFLSLSLMYFPSGLTKTYSPMWTKGLGLWTPLNIPHNKWNALPNLIINQHWLMVGLNYAVILWEILFVFLLFIPRLHAFLVIPGILFHLGIGLLFPFPIVCTGPILFYTLFIPDSFWEWLKKRMSRPPSVALIVDTETVTGQRIKRVVEALDYAGKFSFIQQNGTGHFQSLLKFLRGYFIYYPFYLVLRFTPLGKIMQVINAYYLNDEFAPNPVSFLRYKTRRTLFIYFTMFCLLMQGGISVYHSYTFASASVEKRVEYMRMRKAGYDLSMKPTNLVRTFFGINSRGLFLDHANTGSKTTYALTYFNADGKEFWLPMMNERGYVKWDLNMNMAWSKVTFNLIAFGTNPADSVGLAKLTKYWTSRNQLPIKDLRMKVYKKTYIYPEQFEKDYYLRLEAQPWVEEGEIHWKNGEFAYQPVNQSTIR